MAYDQRDYDMLRRHKKKLHLDCTNQLFSKKVSEILENKGYRYGYNGNPCQRRDYSNMPFIVVDVANGFYHGTKGADVAVNWVKMNRDRLDTLENQLPDIHDIHDKALRNDGAVDRHMRQPSKDGRKMERFWITRTGRSMPISEMTDDHLHNTILMVDRTIAEGCDSIGGNQDLANMLDELEDERIHRGLHLPLIPLTSLEYRKAVEGCVLSEREN